MSGINFLSENLTNEATLSITTGAENSQFPLSNLQQESTTKKFRSTGNTVVIEVDLGQTREIDTFAIVGHAVDGLGITALSIKTSVTNDFSGSTAIPITLSTEFNMGYEFITQVEHRYVELTVTGTGSYCELSNFFIGKRTNLPLNSFSISSFRYRNDDRSETQFNDYGQQFSNILNYRKRLVGTIEYCTKSEVETLDELFLAHGRHDPLWVIIDPDSDAMNNGNYKLTMYGYMEKMPSFNAVGGQLFNTSMELNQVI